MDEQKYNIEYDIADVVIGRPYGFSVGHKQFNLYPVTLAKMYLLRRQIDSLGINYDILLKSQYVEALRLVTTHREICCHILAYHTAPNTYKDLYDRRSITIRKNVFEKDLTDEEMATLLIMVLEADKSEMFMKFLGIDKEKERMAQVMEIKRKSGSNNVNFGGLSVFGTFIGQLKEMGYSDNEILYEKGYTYLRLMLADKITSVYLTKEEMEQIPALTLGATVMDASDPANAEKILMAFKSKGVEAPE